MDLGSLTFRRSFGPLEVEAWDDLLACVALHTPTLEMDSMSWRHERNGGFSTWSLYGAITAVPGPEPLCQIWSIKVPFKIWIFLWQWIRGRVPSGVEVLKHNGPGDCYL